MKQCRICYDSENQEELISPCLCKGSQKWVHVECLNEWRATSQQSFYKCPTCKYEYRVERTQWAKYVHHPYTLVALTLIIIILIILFIAYFLNFFLYILGSGFVQNAWQISRQVVWWATIAVGIAAFVFLTDREDFNFNFDSLYFFSFSNLMYYASFAGLSALFALVYAVVKHYCMQLLNILGEKILQVNPDEE
eukprot:NODE_156_length_15158_cov_0.791553.p8 type:complete len:194 gc:universal NODE_156_length_15158_cov_0.791553:14238-14819(+)